MKFIHIADVHASKERKEQAVKILRTLQDYTETHKDIDFVVFAGDFWDSTITNTQSSGFAEIVNEMNRLNSLCPVKMIYGTAGHEANGSLEVFKTLGIEVHSEIEFSEKEKILWIPEPRKSLFIRQTQEETASAIREYLNKISLYKDVTLAVVHGEIEGAVYDNGTPCNSPISIPKSLLKQTGAKYIAAGHIHTPQVIKDINCWYAGSSAPLNFGETHDGHFNIVTIKEDVSVEEVSFGFPQNITAEINFTDLEGFCKSRFENKNLKIKLTCPSKINKKNLEKEVAEKTGCFSCKITPVYENKSSIRSEKIIKQMSITDKLKTYAEINGIKISQNALKTAYELEENMLIKYRFPSHSFRLLYASIKGAIGIEKPEVTLDFSKYSSGVIVMIGHNGAGKTTILENLHPYPCMLTRTGKLRDHFYARDSHRILIYADETGKKYKITMQIVADIKTGSVKYYVETDSGDGWKPVKECDGNLDSYSKYVEETFGSLPLFMRTSFFTDKETSSCPDISKTTKSERMDLFSKLAGTDHFATLHQITKDTAKDLSLQIKNLMLTINSKPKTLETQEVLQKKKEELAREVSSNLEELKTKKSVFSELRKRDIEYQKYLAKEEESRLLFEKISNEIDGNNSLAEQVKKDKELADNLESKKNEIQLFKDFSEKSKILKDELIEFQSKVSSVDSKLNGFAVQISEQEVKLGKEDSEIKVLLNNLEHEKEHIHNSSSDNCPYCGAKLSEKKQNELFTEAKLHKEKAISIENAIAQHKQEKENILKVIETIRKESNVEEEKKSSLEKEFSELKQEIILCNTSLQKLYDAKIDEIVNSKPMFSDHDSKILQLEAKNAELVKQLKKNSVNNKPEDVSDKLQEAEGDVENCLAKDKELCSYLKKIETDIENNEHNLQVIQEAETEIKNLESKLTDYETLTKAFSNSGIQALELEAVIPNIIEQANAILHSSYGDNFTINFSATRQGTTKLIEDFNLTVFNASKNREETLDNVSAGELVWIKQALYYAFSVSRQNNTGFCFLTRFMDESDGHLDSAMRVKYMQMINAAHLAGNAEQTILVTHSQEIKDVAEQIIEL